MFREGKHFSCNPTFWRGSQFRIDIANRDSRTNLKTSLSKGRLADIFYSFCRKLVARLLGKLLLYFITNIHIKTHKNNWRIESACSRTAANSCLLIKPIFFKHLCQSGSSCTNKQLLACSSCLPLASLFRHNGEEPAGLLCRPYSQWSVLWTHLARESNRIQAPVYRTQNVVDGLAKAWDPARTGSQLVARSRLVDSYLIVN